MDMRKVFNDEGKTPAHSVNKVEKSRLKVELCEGCAYLSQRFSELCRQREKLDIELGSCLTLIHGKLAVHNGLEDVQQRVGVDCNLNSHDLGVLEIFNVLRMDATSKCSDQLKADRPRIKIEKLTANGIRAKKSKIKNKFREAVITHQRTTFSQSASQAENNETIWDFGQNSIKVELEPLSSELISDDDYIRDDLDFVDEPTSKVADDRQHALLDKQEGGATHKWSINPDTGKYKCGHCPKEFAGHSDLYQHSSSVHKRLKASCQVCNKAFTIKNNLLAHQRMTSCGEKLGIRGAPKHNCHLCGKQFSRKYILQTHLEGVHMKVNKYGCDLCGKKI